MLNVEWTNEVGVNHMRAQSHRQVEIEQEGALQQPIERKVVGDSVREELHHIQQSENHPIGQPLSVVILASAFDSSNGDISRIEKARDVAQQLGPSSKQQVESMKHDQASNNMKSLDARLCFHRRDEVGYHARFM